MKTKQRCKKNAVEQHKSYIDLSQQHVSKRQLSHILGEELNRKNPILIMKDCIEKAVMTGAHLVVERRAARVNGTLVDMVTRTSGQEPIENDPEHYLVRVLVPYTTGYESREDIHSRVASDFLRTGMRRYLALFPGDPNPEIITAEKCGKDGKYISISTEQTQLIDRTMQKIIEMTEGSAFNAEHELDHEKNSSYRYAIKDPKEIK
ncbi:MAG: hypothetical protein V1729_03890 [Candidatus Woesearchaeota archaeon]